MYWLGIAKRITNEQRILAQRSRLSQRHPLKSNAQKIRGRRERRITFFAICKEMLVAGAV
jgi:hypothetical protein